MPDDGVINQVGLGDDRDLRGAADSRQLGGDELVAGADRLISREAEPDDVDLAPGVAHEGVEAFTEQGAWLVKAGRVDEYQLRVVAVDDAPDGVTRGLRLTRGDGDLLAHQGVGERGLAGIGSADETSEAGAMIGHSAIVPHREAPQRRASVQGRSQVVMVDSTVESNDTR
ncbi:unannotated protein [freshwater metagenome]|uniref:Unannotated protein n=1 Tax=freshwater metagenome TaxID=449393 RepID=A0A6J7BNU2_9ZZZZ